MTGTERTLRGEGFAFFAWHCMRYPGAIGEYCTSNPWAHRDYCMTAWERYRNEV